MQAISQLSFRNFENYVFPLKQFAKYHYENWFVVCVTQILACLSSTISAASSSAETSIFLRFIAQQLIYIFLFLHFCQNVNYADGAGC